LPIFFLQHPTSSLLKSDVDGVHSLIGKDMVTVSQCKTGGNATTVDLVDMPDLDIDLGYFIIVMDSTGNLIQKPHQNHNRI
jgi:hypothetical protein